MSSPLFRLPYVVLLLIQPISSNCKSSPFISNPKSKAAFAAPSRLEENAEGVLYVNSQCISCSACKMLAPDTFDYSQNRRKFVVSHQPNPDQDTQFDQARAAMAACPVSAIRVENSAQRNHSGRDKLTSEEEQIAKQFTLSPKVNQRSLPFPRPVPGLEGYGIHYLGHHNSASFGAVPYLITSNNNDSNSDHPSISIMVDTPKFSKAAVKSVLSLTGGKALDYLLITHVDDSADHGKWQEQFPSLKRIFHEGDLGVHNWVGDETLEDVEILLKGETNHAAITIDKDDDGSLFQGWKAWTLEGDDFNPTNLDNFEKKDPFVILHTPGHSPGSICLLFHATNHVEGETESKYVLFTGDTYAYSAKEKSMSGFPLFGNDKLVQSQTLRKLLTLPKWDAILPGHGLKRLYLPNEEQRKKEDIDEAVKGLL